MNESQDVTRSRLLDATLAVLADRGVAEATSRRIAATAGVNLQAITYHFGSKDDLIAQSLVHAVRRWTEPARAALTGIADDPVGGLSTVAGALSQALDEAREALPAYLEAMAAATRRPDVRDRIRTLIDDLRAELATALRTLAAAGLLADWVDPETMAALIVAAGDGFVLHATIAPERFDPDDALRQVTRLLLSASTLTAPPMDA
jgi:AcrR family transcriptional regulator